MVSALPQTGMRACPCNSACAIKRGAAWHKPEKAVKWFFRPHGRAQNRAAQFGFALRSFKSGEAEAAEGRNHETNLRKFSTRVREFFIPTPAVKVSPADPTFRQRLRFARNEQAAAALSKTASRLGPVHVRKMRRIIWHWSGGRRRPNRSVARCNENVFRLLG